MVWGKPHHGEQTSFCDIPLLFATYIFRLTFWLFLTFCKFAFDDKKTFLNVVKSLTLQTVWCRLWRLKFQNLWFFFTFNSNGGKNLNREPFYLFENNKSHILEYKGKFCPIKYFQDIHHQYFILNLLFILIIFLTEGPLYVHSSLNIISCFSCNIYS